jgi:hypothetical protein
VVQTGTISKERILKYFVNPNHPVCASAVASHLFLMAQPPPLYQEGNSQPDTHPHLHRPHLQQIHNYLDSLLEKEGTGCKTSTSIVGAVYDRAYFAVAAADPAEVCESHSEQGQTGVFEPNPTYLDKVGTCREFQRASIAK